MGRTAELVRLTCVVLATLVLVGSPGAVGTAGDGPSRDAAVALDDTRSYFVCVPVQVASFASRVHVRCQNGYSIPPDTITYFAVSTQDTAEAARALSVFETAMVGNLNVGIHFNPADTSGAAFGCLVSDCRIAWGVVLTS